MSGANDPSAWVFIPFRGIKKERIHACGQQELYTQFWLRALKRRDNSVNLDTKVKQMKNKKSCRFDESRSLEDGSITNFRSLMYIKYSLQNC
jgi:hypothetical protein